MIKSSAEHIASNIPFGINCSLIRNGPIFRIYKIIDNQKTKTPIPIASFQDFSVYTKYTYSYSGLEKKDLVVKIKSTKSDKKGILEKEFSLSEAPNDLMQFITLIRMGALADDVAQEFWEWLRKDNFSIEENNSISTKKQILRVAPAYGIFKKKLIITPNDFEIENEGLDLDEDEYIAFKKNYPKIDEKIDLNELKIFLITLHRYLSNDKTNVVTFAYCLAGVYRFVLFSEYKLKEFPYFVIESKNKSDVGKTSKGKLFTSLFTSWYTENPFNPEYLKNTYSRIRSVQYMNLPIHIDEVSTYSQEIAENLKALGTSNKVNFKIGDNGGQNTKSRLIIRGAMIFTVNQLNIRDENLRKRFISQNLENCKVGYDDVDKDYDYLYDNTTIFMKYFWSNQDKLLEQVYINTTKRANSKFEILNLGVRVMNFIFKEFDLEPIEYDVKEFLDTQETNTITINDELRSLILSFIEKRTTVTGHKVGIWNLLDIKALINKRYQNNLEYLDEHFQEVSNKIIEKAESLGIYVTKNGNDLLFTKKFCKRLEMYSPKFKGLNVPRDLLNYFYKNECEVISSSEQKKNISNFYGISTNSKTGMLFYLNSSKTSNDDE